jgi:hypothetical protein
MLVISEEGGFHDHIRPTLATAPAWYHELDFAFDGPKRPPKRGSTHSLVPSRSKGTTE